MLNGTDRPHVEDMKNPDKILLPSRNLVLIALGEDESVDRVPFPSLAHLPLDRGHGTVIETSVSESPSGCITGLAHVVSSPIASRTVWLS